MGCSVAVAGLEPLACEFAAGGFTPQFTEVYGDISRCVIFYLPYLECMGLADLHTVFET